MTAICIGLAIVYLVLVVWFAVEMWNAKSDVELWDEEVE